MANELKELVKNTEDAEDMIKNGFSMFRRAYKVVQAKTQEEDDNKDSFEEANLFGTDISNVSDDLLRNLENFKRIVAAIQKQKDRNSVDLLTPNTTIVPPLNELEFFKKNKVTGKLTPVKFELGTFKNGNLKKNCVVKDVKTGKLYNKKTIPTEYRTRIREELYQIELDKGW